MSTETRNSLIAGHMNIRHSMEQAQRALPYWNDSDDKVITISRPIVTYFSNHDNLCFKTIINF